MITILDVAKARGAKEISGTISGEEFERLGLPIIGGCEGCGETLACYNMYPSRSGNVRCRECLGDVGFRTIREFENFSREAA